MIAVRRLGHATLTTPDLESQIADYTDIVGLALVDRSARRPLLASRQGLEAIALEPGAPNALSGLAFQVAPGSDLGEIARSLASHGIPSERRRNISPGIDEAIAFHDPKGTRIEIFSKYRFAAEDRKQSGIMPIKLGHVAYRVRNVQEVVKFYTDVLGFRVSDWRDDTFAFLRCGPDHHTVNFVHDERRSFTTSPSRSRTGRRSRRHASGSPRTTFISSGGRVATSSATTSRSITATPTRSGSSSSARWIR